MSGLIIFLAIALALLIALLTAMLAWEMRHPPRRTATYAIARGMAADPGELGLQFQEWQLDRPDGARLPVWDIANSNPEHHNNQPITAVLVHGWGHSRIHSLARVKPFLPWCERIIMYDLRGHGEAQGGATRLGCDEADDLFALLERVNAHRVALVGHSMGAVIAINAAAQASSRDPKIASTIAGIIASGAYCDFHRSLRGRLNAHGYPSRPITDLALLVHRIAGIKPPGIDEKTLAQIHCPMLLLHGEHDRIAPLEHARHIAATVSDSTLRIFPDAAHADLHAVDESMYESAIAEYMQRLMSDPAAIPPTFSPGREKVEREKSSVSVNVPPRPG